MGKNKYFGATKKASLFPILLAVFCCAVTLTIAFFFNSDFASSYLGISGKVEIIAVGKGDEYNSIENSVSSSNLVIELDQNRDTLIPGMPLRMDVNCKVKRSTTKPLLRAWLSLDLYDVDTMEKIDDWGEDAGVIIDINNQLDDVITTNSKWVLHNDGFYYYVTSIDETNVGDSILQEIDATAGDIIIPFIDKQIKFPTLVDGTYSGFGVKIRVTFQAIQNYIPDDNGQKLPNTIDNSYKIFNGFGSMYESTPVSMFDFVENRDGTVTIKAKAGVTYPNTINLPTHTADGKVISKIEDEAFRNNKNITNVYIPYTYTYIGWNAFRSSSVLNVDARDSKIEVIKNGAFQVSNLTSIKLPNTLKRIESYAFNGTTNLVSLHIPASVEYIEAGVFYQNYKMSTITVDKDNQHYYDIDGHSLVSKDGVLLNVFQSYTDYLYEIPDEITEFGYIAFALNKKITTINLGKNVTSFGSIFSQTTLSYVNICDNPYFEYLTDAYGNKFLKNKNDTKAVLVTLASNTSNISIPDEITEITSALRPRNLLTYFTSVSIGKSLTGTKNTTKYLVELTPAYLDVSAENTSFKTVTGAELLSADGKIFYWYLGRNPASTYTVPSGVERIATFGKMDRSMSLKKLIMTSDVKVIDARCLNGLVSVEELVLSGEIGHNNVETWNGLLRVTLLDTVTSIEYNFMNSGNRNMQWVEFQSTTVPNINATNFLNAVKNSSTFVIYVPDASVDAYKSATAFANFVDRIKPVSERPSA